MIWIVLDWIVLLSLLGIGAISAYEQWKGDPPLWVWYWLLWFFAIVNEVANYA